MKGFSIKELETLTGVKTSTLRAWERRYQVFDPQRTSGNNRLYSMHELDKALSLALLTRNGFKISALSRLSQDQLADQLLWSVYPDSGHQKNIHDLIMAMHKLDTERFTLILDQCLKSWGMNILLNDIIYPFLQRTRLLWEGSRLTEEHFVVTAIRSKIIHGIEQVDATGRKNKKILLFLPSTGQLDLCLLYTSYVLKSGGFQVLYMGNDVSMENLKAAIDLKKPDAVFSYLPRKTRFSISELSTYMQVTVPLTPLILVNNGGLYSQFTGHSNLHLLNYAEALAAVCS